MGAASISRLQKCTNGNERCVQQTGAVCLWASMSKALFWAFPLTAAYSTSWYRRSGWGTAHLLLRVGLHQHHRASWISKGDAWHTIPRGYPGWTTSYMFSFALQIFIPMQAAPPKATAPRILRFTGFELTGDLQAHRHHQSLKSTTRIVLTGSHVRLASGVLRNRASRNS